MGERSRLAQLGDVAVTHSEGVGELKEIKVLCALADGLDGFFEDFADEAPILDRNKGLVVSTVGVLCGQGSLEVGGSFMDHVFDCCHQNRLGRHRQHCRPFHRNSLRDYSDQM